MKKQKVQAKINLEALAGGAFAEKLTEALMQVAENIQNPNTEATTKRQITVNIKFTPNKTRQMVGTPTPGQNPTGKPLDLKNRGKQAPAAAAELVPGRDYDPDTGEVYETAGQSADNHQTTGGRNNMKVVKIAPVKEA